MTTKYDQALLKTAYNFAELSHCKRLQVGSVVARDGRPLITGYNGTLAGTDNCCEEQVGFSLYCKRCGCDDQELLHIGDTDGDIFQNLCDKCEYINVVDRVPDLRTKKSVIHAERNAIYYAARNGIRLEGTDMYITHAPCEDCSTAIITSGIKRVVFAEEYRDSNGIQYLRDNGVEVILVPLSKS